MLALLCQLTQGPYQMFGVLGDIALIKSEFTVISVGHRNIISEAETEQQYSIILIH